jgi:PadR family transcriptional regulator AphA
MLTKMEQKEFIVHEHVKQMGKPDKKIFSITEKGKAALEKWNAESPSDTVNKDEFLIKVYSMWLSDKESSIKLIQDRISRLKETMANLSNKLVEMEQKSKLDPMSKHFGRYILFNRKIRLVEEEKTWCQWVLDLIKNKSLKISMLCFSAGKFSSVIEKLVVTI